MGLGQTNMGLGQTNVEVGQTNVGLGQTNVGLGQTNVGVGQTNVGVGQTNVGVGLTEDDCCPRKRLCDTSGACQTSGDSHVTEDDSAVDVVGAGENYSSTRDTHLPAEKEPAYQDQKKLVHPTQSSITVQTAQPCRAIPGHTGFLTFATLSAVEAAESHS